MNVYNIVWADDEIDEILSDTALERLKKIGIKVIATAHDGQELEEALGDNAMNVDAVIVDANFNESSVEINNERDTSGLDYARSLYVHRYKRAIPFFLFTNRSDELLAEIYASNPRFLEDFPRHKRWFNKSGQGEKDELFEAIKEAVEEQKSTSFMVRNRYRLELNAAKVIDDGAYDYLLDCLTREHEGTLEEMREPFVTARRTIEKAFMLAEKRAIIPPISDDLNGSAAYLYYKCYKKSKDSEVLFEMVDKDIIAMPLAESLRYIVKITQDASHSKSGLKLNVDRYFEETGDTLLLKSVLMILMDFLKWLVICLSLNKSVEENRMFLWKDVSAETPGDVEEDRLDETDKENAGYECILK